jgi:hypothetical protein
MRPRLADKDGNRDVSRWADFRAQPVFFALTLRAQAQVSWAVR